MAKNEIETPIYVDKEMTELATACIEVMSRLNEMSTSDAASDAAIVKSVIDELNSMDWSNDLLDREIDRLSSLSNNLSEVEFIKKKLISVKLICSHFCDEYYNKVQF